MKLGTIFLGIFFFIILGNAYSAEFSCENMHSSKSFIKLDEPLLFGNPTVQYKLITQKKWQKARLVDHGGNWFSFLDGWGYFGEDSKSSSYSSCKKYKDECGELMKVIEYPNSNSVSVLEFTVKNCCYKGEDYKSGQRIGWGTNCSLLKND